MLVSIAGGCGSTTNNNQPSQLSHQVEQSISNKLVQVRGVRPKSVSCPQSMQPTKGKVYRCTLTAPAGGTIGVTVTMQGGKNFQFAVDQRPAP
ncbi:MAG: DUF4333 domain-containing protein [Pseudonocardiales bacterium]|nr:DUF4333 domain-containing protein [Pseudonocardiales bacterium]